MDWAHKFFNQITSNDFTLPQLKIDAITGNKQPPQHNGLKQQSKTEVGSDVDSLCDEYYAKHESTPNIKLNINTILSQSWNREKQRTPVTEEYIKPQNAYPSSYSNPGQLYPTYNNEHSISTSSLYSDQMNIEDVEWEKRKGFSSDDNDSLLDDAYGKSHLRNDRHRLDTNKSEKESVFTKSYASSVDGLSRSIQDVNFLKNSGSQGDGLSSESWNIDHNSCCADHDDQLSEENVVDVMGDVVEDETSLAADTHISLCGTIDVALQYSLSDKKLQITVVEANDLPSKDRGGSSIIQVRIVILPTKKRRFRTKVQHISTPQFAETFKLSRISPELLRSLGIRIRLYGIGKVKDRLIGEAALRFDELNLIRDPQLTLTLLLEPRTDVNRGDVEVQPSVGGRREDESSVKTLAHGGSLPELLVSLSYDETTGRLCVEIIKGSHFRNLAMSKPPDTYVKIVLLNSSCQEMSHSKTTVRRNQPNPVYKETFYFQVAFFQLPEVSMMMSVMCAKTVKKDEMLGWISMGRNNSCESEEQHWHEMCGAGGKQVSRWHTLVDS